MTSDRVARERSERTSIVNVAKRSAAERVSGVSGAIMQGTSTHLSLNSCGSESVFFSQT